MEIEKKILNYLFLNSYQSENSQYNTQIKELNELDQIIIRTLALIQNEDSNAIKLIGNLEKKSNQLTDAQKLKLIGLKLHQLIGLDSEEKIIEINKYSSKKDEILENNNSKSIKFWNALILLEISNYHWTTGNLQASFKAVKQAHHTFKMINSLYYLGRAKLNLGLIYHMKGNNGVAKKNVLHALSIYMEISHEIKKGDCYNLLGNIFREEGNLKNAMINFKIADEIFSRNKHKRKTATSSANLAIIYWRLGDFENAENLFKNSLDLYQEIGTMTSVASCYENLGILHGSQGNYEKSEKFLKNCLKIRKEINSGHHQISKSLYNLGYYYEEIGNYRLAISYYKESLELKKQINNRREIALVRSKLANSYINQGDIKRSVRSLQHAYNIAIELENQILISSILKSKIDVYEKIGEPFQSLENLEELIKILEKNEMVPDLISILRKKLRILYDDRQTIEDFDIVFNDTFNHFNKILSFKEKNDLNNMKNFRYEIKFVNFLKLFNSGLNNENINNLDEIIISLLSGDEISYSLKIQIRLKYIELLISKHLKDQNKEHLQLIKSQTFELIQISEKQHLNILRVKLEMIMMKLEALNLNVIGLKNHYELGKNLTRGFDLEIYDDWIDFEFDSFLNTLVENSIETEEDISLLREILISDFDNYVKSILEYIRNVENNPEFHFYKNNNTYCNLSRDTVESYKAKYNINESKVKCKKCTKILKDKAIDKLIRLYISSFNCFNCNQGLALSEIEDLIKSQKETHSKNWMKTSIFWKCNNFICAKNGFNEINLKNFKFSKMV